ncbi:heterokaryon incompatibility protein-domain-containing protein [Paraphoma chrysanthemicola]|uniref:Heterokaryon incompatibility protein-domain-containing protein n=1 Tax=Paraphoma chrysanthemicola TaxID=798071 RepID=A0A8K0R8B5_9PLEO|nr:heterokaryon incompatibility protein-domain-containing protein [Paraphoma chrysanthemicola]
MVPSRYNYQPIRSEEGETRILTLYPGQNSDQIQISLSPWMLRQTSASPTKHRDNINLRNVRDTLPSGWTATTTDEGRLIFHRNFKESSWSHPDADHGYKKEIQVPISDSLKEGPGFEALSYCWGPTEPQERLMVEPSDDDNLNNPPTGPGLASALRHLRYSDRTRILWVDALCINQLDLKERQNLVARMGHVYKQASRVIVWLGCESYNSSQALNALELMGQQIELLHESARVPAPASMYPEWLLYYPCEVKTINAVRDILKRPWFTRVWIWQEIVLGSAETLVYCGHTSVLWYNLRRGIILLRETNLPDPRMRDGLIESHVTSLIYCHEDFGHLEIGLTGLVESIASSACTEPRDRIYGLLGLCRPDIAKGISVDYKSDIALLFQSLVTAYLRTCNSLIPLRLCDFSSRRLDTPSWVPDLKNINPRTTTFAFASGNTETHAKVLSGRELSALGVHAGKVSAVSTVQMHGVSTSVLEAFRTIEAWYSLASCHASPNTLTEFFFTAIFQGWVKERRGDQLGISTKMYSEELLRFLEVTNEPTRRALDQSELIQNFMRDERHCAFLCTDQGCLGLGPVGTRSGDSIAVLLGFPMCVVLRPKGDVAFQILGPAFVHGLNEAQGILGKIPYPWVPRVHRPGDFLRFDNIETGETTFYDPRLAPLDNGWVMKTVEESGAYEFYHAATGLRTRTDPRCNLSELQKKVGVEEFLIV